MYKPYSLLMPAMLAALLGGCAGKGDSAPPPSDLAATAGDGRVKLTWTATPGVDYWLFSATDSSLTAFNWTGLKYGHAYISAPEPFYLCGLIDDMTYYMAANARIDGGPGGASSATVNATPYNVSTRAWTLNTVPSAVWPPNITPTTPDLFGTGYTSLTTCSNMAHSAAGRFMSVGAGGALYVSNDGMTWNVPASPPAGFTSDLHAVTGNAINQNNPTNPSLLWIAVGAGGNSIYSNDLTSDTWTAGNSTSVTTSNLNAITHYGTTFVAVGDAGTVVTTTDGITWTVHPITTVTTSNLNGITHGSYYVAVGDNGTILTSVDANSWTSHTVTNAAVTSNLRKVAYFGSIIVAVGDGGAIVTSKDNGVTWYSSSTSPTANNLVGIAVEPLAYDYTNTALMPDAWLGVIPTAQFVVMDNLGNVYRSVTGTDPNANGLTWDPTSIATGIANANGLVSSGFGYVAVGNAGATASAF